MTAFGLLGDHAHVSHVDVDVSRTLRPAEKLAKNLLAEPRGRNCRRHANPMTAGTQAVLVEEPKLDRFDHSLSAEVDAAADRGLGLGRWALKAAAESEAAIADAKEKVWQLAAACIFGSSVSFPRVSSYVRWVIHRFCVELEEECRNAAGSGCDAEQQLPLMLDHATVLDRETREYVLTVTVC